MVVTQPVTEQMRQEPVGVWVPDVAVRRVSIDGDLISAEFEMGAPPESWTASALKEEARTLLLGLENTKESRQTYSALMFAMRQEKRVLEEKALKEFLTLTRTDGIAAFVQKYGLFKHPGQNELQIRVSIDDFKREQAKLHALLSVWAELRQGDEEEAQALAKDAGMPFAGDPHFVLSVHLSEKLLHHSVFTLIAIKERLEPILYCHDVLTGLYGLLFQAVAAGRPWVTCLNCRNAFAARPKGKKFCSERCQQAFKQRRYREGLKRRNKKSRGRR